MKLRSVLTALTALLLMTFLIGCNLFGDRKEPSPGPVSESEEEELDPEYPVSAGGVQLLARPGKVISLAPSLTEKLFDLGMTDRLTGVSDYCDYPSAVADLPPCGTAQLPDVEVIAALEPHLVLAEAELPEEAAAFLAEQGIPVAVFPHAESLSGLMENYIDLARLLEGEVSGAAMGRYFSQEYQGMLSGLSEAAGRALGENSPKTVLYLRLLDFTVATGDTFENELLRAIHLQNLAEDYTGWTYPEEEAKTPEGQAGFAGVDIIYMDEDFVTIKDLEQNSFYKGLPATIHDRFLYISSIVLERQGMRALEELARMTRYAYPEAVMPDWFAGDAGGDGPEGAEEEETEAGAD